MKYSRKRKSRKNKRRSRRRSKSFGKERSEKKRRSKYGAFIIDIVQEITNIYLDINEASIGLFSLASGYIAKWAYKTYKKNRYANEIVEQIKYIKDNYDHHLANTNDNLISYIIDIMARNFVYKTMTGDFYLKDKVFLPHPRHLEFNAMSQPGISSVPGSPRHLVRRPTNGHPILHTAASARNLMAVSPQRPSAPSGGMVEVPIIDQLINAERLEAAAAAGRKKGEPQIISENTYDNIIIPAVKALARKIYGQYKKDVLEKAFELFD